MPEGLGVSYRCHELFDGPIRVTEHPGNLRQVELALHGGVGTRPIRELHLRIEHLEAPPKACKRRFELPLVEQRPGERHVPPDQTGRIVTAYWPSFALVLAPFTWLGIPWACNPLLSAGTVLATCLPALRAAMLCGAWSPIGLLMCTASTLGSFSSSS